MTKALISVRIIELIKKRKDPFVSLEFFPPREQARWPSFFKSVRKLAEMDPLFVSVTYGAMGSTREHTLEIVTRLKKVYGLEAMAHLTCVGASPRNVEDFLNTLRSSGIDNVLALRGDIPDGRTVSESARAGFRNASDLVEFIRGLYPEMGLAVAAYPEAHPQATSIEEDIAFLKKKLDCGADFAITQLFFENRYFREFMERARSVGIDKPIIPGILPIYNMSSVEKIVSLCGATIPPDYAAQLSKAQQRAGDRAVRNMGVKFATEQIRGLLDGGVRGFHLYTLNRAAECLDIVKGLGLA